MKKILCFILVILISTTPLFAGGVYMDGDVHHHVDKINPPDSLGKMYEAKLRLQTQEIQKLERQSKQQFWFGFGAGGALFGLLAILFTFTAMSTQKKKMGELKKNLRPVKATKPAIA